MITIRAEVPDDVAAIHDVNRAAFGQEAEAHLVDRLRALGNLTCTVTYPDVFKLVD
jgi:predicted N-acetyltransferase YhbS